MSSLVKVPPYSKWNFQGKFLFTPNWCNITLSSFKTPHFHATRNHLFDLICPFFNFQTDIIGILYMYIWKINILHFSLILFVKILIYWISRLSTCTTIQTSVARVLTQKWIIWTITKHICLKIVPIDLWQHMSSYTEKTYIICYIYVKIICFSTIFWRHWTKYFINLL